MTKQHSEVHFTCVSEKDICGQPVEICHIAINALKGLVEPTENFNVILLELLISILQLLQEKHAGNYQQAILNHKNGTTSDYALLELTYET